MKYTIKIPPIGRHSKLFGNEKGMVIAVVLMLVAVLVILGTTAIMTVTTDMKIAGNYRESQKALYNAEAGVETVIAYLRTNDVEYATANASPTVINNGTCPPPTAYNDTCPPVSPRVSCTCTPISITPPTGFTFSSTVNLYGYDMTKRLYLFRMTGTGANNATRTIEVVIKKFTDLPLGADGAVAMYGGGPQVKTKTGANPQENYAIDGYDHPVPSSPNCNGNSSGDGTGTGCSTTRLSTGAVSGLFTVMTPTVNGTVGGSSVFIGGEPDQKLGASREAEYTAFVNKVIANNLYQTTMGTRANPAITVVPSGASLVGSYNGAGILIVRDGGEVTLAGNGCYEGLIILQGSGTVKASGNNTIYGSLVTIGHDSKLITATGTINMSYSSVALSNLSNINSSANITQRTAWRDVF